MPGIIVDDAELRESGNFVGLAGWTTVTGAANAHNGTISSCVPPANSSSPSPWISFSFYGTEIRLVGRPSTGLRLNYTIDSSSVRPAVLSVNDTDVGKDGALIWELLGLESASYHSVYLYPIAGELDVDYISYLPTNKYASTRDIVLLDDQDPFKLVTYSGSWNSEASVSKPSGYPFNQTITDSSSTGASFSVNFTGDSVSVQGLLAPVAGTLAASYTIDNRTPVNVTHFDGSQTVNASSWALSQTLYKEDLVPGQHLLTVRVTEVTGDQRFYLDYVTYEATSSTLLIPSAVAGSLPPGTSSGITSSSDNGVRTINYGAIVGAIVAFVIIAYLFRLAAQRRNRSLANRPLVPLQPPIPSRPWQPPPPPWSPPAIPRNNFNNNPPWPMPPPPMPQPQPQPWVPIPVPVPVPVPTPNPAPPRNNPLQPEVGNRPPPFSPPRSPPPPRQDRARSPSPEFLESAMTGEPNQPEVGAGTGTGAPVGAGRPSEPGARLSSLPPGRPRQDEVPAVGAPPPYVG